jgi:hypothetical protein
MNIAFFKELLLAPKLLHAVAYRKFPGTGVELHSAPNFASIAEG